MTYFPGSGNFTLYCSVVGQVSMLARFATNISGKVSIAEPSPPVILASMQFMYISRLPMVLNQVQAIVALPLLRPFGMVKLNEFMQSGELLPLHSIADGRLPLIYYKESQPLKDLTKLFQTNGEGQVVEVTPRLLFFDRLASDSFSRQQHQAKASLNNRRRRLVLLYRHEKLKLSATPN